LTKENLAKPIFSNISVAQINTESIDSHEGGVCIEKLGMIEKVKRTRKCSINDCIFTSKI